MEQLKFLKAVSTKGIFDEEYLLLHKKSLKLFHAKVDNAMEDIGKLFKLEWVRRPDGQYEKKLMPRSFKYAFKKSSLDELISALELWHNRCDPSWYLMLRNNSPGVRAALRESPELSRMNSVSVVRSNLRDAATVYGSAKGLKLEAADIQKMETNSIAMSSARMAVARRSSGKMSQYILDRCSVGEERLEGGRRKDIVVLAKRLQHEEPETFNLLQCKGYVEDTEFNQATSREQIVHTIVFRLPPQHSRPKSLRQWLINGSPPASLSHRFALAKQLAKAVTYVHIFGFVHKNIHPGAILCFEKANTDVPSAFLAGFELFRDEDGKTSRRGDNVLEKNLYRHWTRQGTEIDNDYIMQHDIYSLGVCMLEIGLWRSFVDLNAADHTYRLSNLFAPHQSSERDQRQHLADIAKHGYIQLCRTELRSVMGTLYAEIVETCLTCLNRGNADFGDPTEFEDEDGIRVGYRYIEKVSIAQL